MPYHTLLLYKARGDMLALGEPEVKRHPQIIQQQDKPQKHATLVHKRLSCLSMLALSIFPKICRRQKEIFEHYKEFSHEDR